jgi:hypothetical protein
VPGQPSWGAHPVLGRPALAHHWEDVRMLAAAARPRVDRRPLGRRPLPIEVAAEVRWAFTLPCDWMLGVAANLALSLIYLLFVPLTGHERGSGVVLVGTYFAVFILADVTTTNLLGPDARRVSASVALGTPLRWLLLVKNLVLLLVVGVPTLALTAGLTLRDDAPSRLAATLPAVALPMFCWIAVGNLVSVLLPVAVVSLRTRWDQRRDRVSTGRWLVHLALPYALLYPVAPLSRIPAALLASFPRSIARSPDVRGAVLSVVGLLIWMIGLLGASLIAGAQPMSPSIWRIASATISGRRRGR